MFLFILIFCCLTSFYHPAVFLTLCLGVELVPISLAVALFGGHAQTRGGIKGPNRWRPHAGFDVNGEAAHSWNHKSKPESEKKNACTLRQMHASPHPQVDISADTLFLLRSCSGCQGSLRSWRAHMSARWSCRSNAGPSQNMAPSLELMHTPLRNGKDTKTEMFNVFHHNCVHMSYDGRLYRFHWTDSFQPRSLQHLLETKRAAPVSSTSAARKHIKSATYAEKLRIQKTFWTRCETSSA